MEPTHRRTIPEEHRIILPNQAEVRFHPLNNDLEAMKEVANGYDFLIETSVMRMMGSSAPMSLLVYDDMLALGLYGQGKLNVEMRAYSDCLLMEWVDKALSWMRQPIRVIEKTGSIGEMFERLSPRLEMDWIEYDLESQILREMPGKECSAVKCLKSMPAKKDLYSIAEHYGKTEVSHLRIEENTRKTGGNKAIDSILCKVHEVKIYDDKIGDVEESLKQLCPDSLVVREPMAHCSAQGLSKPYACLAVKFEQVYASKVWARHKSDPFTSETGPKGSC